MPGWREANVWLTIGATMASHMAAMPSHATRRLREVRFIDVSVVDGGANENELRL
jgi:phage terminase Nu1 subunit (DNA packaging protein)